MAKYRSKQPIPLMKWFMKDVSKKQKKMLKNRRDKYGDLYTKYELANLC